MSSHEQRRPALPLFQQVGSKDGEVTQFGAMLRVGRVILAVLNPVAVVVMWLLLLVLSRVRAIRPAWLVLTGALATVGALALGWVARYNTVWRELYTAASAAVSERSADPIGAVIAERWLSWLIWQIPAGVCFGLLLAGVVLAYRDRYRATWRARSRPASRRRVARAGRKIDHRSWVAEKVRRRPRTADELQLRLGIDCHSAEPFSVPGSAFRMHAVVGGPTGFGKSTTLRRLLDQFIVDPDAQPLRVGLVMIDMKGDRGMRSFVELVAASAGRRAHIVTGRAEDAHYNPFRYGDGDELASLLMETESNAADGGFSEPHYRAIGERFLRLVANVLVDLADRQKVDSIDGRRRPWRRDLPDLVRLMNLQTLGKQTDRLTPPLARQLAGFLAEVKEVDSLRRDVYGIYTRFALIAEGPAGRVLTADGETVDLPAAIEAGDLVLFSLGVSDAGTSRQIGNLAIQDLEKSLARMPAHFYDEEAHHGMALTMLDEFSALGGSLVAGLYARARSAGGAVVLASQTLHADLAGVSDEFASAVLDNANVIVLHQQRGDSPEKWANHFGTREVWKETVQLTSETGILGRQDAASGMGSLREVHEYVVAPDTLRNLPQGQAVVFVGHPERTLTTVAVSRPRDMDPTTSQQEDTGSQEQGHGTVQEHDSGAVTNWPLRETAVSHDDDDDADGSDAPLIDLPER